MKNNLEILDNIMKPYFDKKKEINDMPKALENDKASHLEKAKELKTERLEKKKELQIELENLRVRAKFTIEDFKQKKESEIEEYISKSMDSDSNFFASYGSFLRRDLEKEYDKKLKEIEDGFKTREQQLLSEIKLLNKISEDEKIEKQNLKNIDEDIDKNLDFSRVNSKELAELKGDLRKQLFFERERLTSELIDLKPEQKLYEKVADELQQCQLEFNEIVSQISNFKYEYNDQNQVINNDEWKILYDRLNLISNEKAELTKKMTEINNSIQNKNNINNSINQALGKLEEYLNLTELTEDETKAIMMSMTSWEQAEYDRRKNAVNNDNVNDEIFDNIDDNEDLDLDDIAQKIFENIDSDSDDVNLDDIANRIDENTKENDDDINLDSIADMIDENAASDDTYSAPETEENDIDEKDIVEVDDPIISHYDQDGENIIVDTKINLLKTIYNDIIKETMNLRTIELNESNGRLGRNQYYIKAQNENIEATDVVNLSGEGYFLEEPIKLPCGEYLNLDDIIQGTENLYNKTESRSYVVTKTKTEYEITQETINKFKSSLKKCSIIRLIKDNKISKFDLFKVYGKEGAGQMLSEIGKIIHPKFSEGLYVSRNELIRAMENLFARKEITFLRKAAYGLKYKQASHDADLTQENVKKR